MRLIQRRSDVIGLNNVGLVSNIAERGAYNNM